MKGKGNKGLQPGGWKVITCFASMERTREGRWEKDLWCGKRFVEVKDTEGEKMMWDLKCDQVNMERGEKRWGWGGCDGDLTFLFFSSSSFFKSWHHGGCDFPSFSPVTGKKTQLGLYFRDVVKKQLFPWLQHTYSDSEKDFLSKWGPKWVKQSN